MVYQKCGFTQEPLNLVGQELIGKADSAADFEELKILTKELLTFATKLWEAPYFITSPTISIVKNHAALIEKYELL